MAFVFTGTKRSLAFKLVKSVGGVVLQGYTDGGKPYDGRLAFPGYAAINDTEAMQLTDSQYNARLTAFLNYIESVETGFDSDNDFTNSPTVTDTGTCPPGGTTTTTTRPVTTTTTTSA